MKVVYFIVIQRELRNALCRVLWKVTRSENPSEKKRINRAKRGFNHTNLFSVPSYVTNLCYNKLKSQLAKLYTGQGFLSDLIAQYLYYPIGVLQNMNKEHTNSQLNDIFPRSFLKNRRVAPRRRLY